MFMQVYAYTICAEFKNFENVRLNFCKTERSIDSTNRLVK